MKNLVKDFIQKRRMKKINKYMNEICLQSMQDHYKLLTQKQLQRFSIILSIFTHQLNEEISEREIKKMTIYE